MTTKTILAALAVLLATAAAPARAAEPFVTVSRAGGGNEAWWLARIESRPTGQGVEGVPLAQINAALGAGQPAWCAADALTNASFASDDPAIRAEMDEDFAREGELFRATLRTGRRELLAVVGHYRACSGDVAPFALLIDREGAAPRVAYVRTFDDWGPFIVVRPAGRRLVFSSCLMCDHAETLAWDGARRFRWRVEGL